MDLSSLNLECSPWKQDNLVPSEFERHCWWEFWTEHKFHAERLARLLTLTRGTDFEFSRTMRSLVNAESWVATPDFDTRSTHGTDFENHVIACKVLLLVFAYSHGSLSLSTWTWSTQKSPGAWMGASRQPYLLQFHVGHRRLHVRFFPSSGPPNVVVVTFIAWWMAPSGAIHQNDSHRRSIYRCSSVLNQISYHFAYWRYGVLVKKDEKNNEMRLERGKHESWTHKNSSTNIAHHDHEGGILSSLRVSRLMPLAQHVGHKGRY